MHYSATVIYFIASREYKVYDKEVLKKGQFTMTKTNWDKVADTIFNNMDNDAQADWGELRAKLR